MFKSAALVIVAYLAAGAVALGVVYLLRAQHPLLILAAADTAATIVVFIFSVITNNSSMYDPYWSVVPVPIALFWLLQPGSSGFASPRHIAVFTLLCLWALRLTYNWASQWKGLSHEDWRYRDMQQQWGRRYWLMSFLGIHLFPTTLVFLGCLALWPALFSGAQPFNWLDVVACVVTASAVLIEATADVQMRRFRRAGARAANGSESAGTQWQPASDQRERECGNPVPARAAPRSGQQAPAAAGAASASGEGEPPGLWRYSRHPNYFGEVSFWWGLFLFALAADASYWWVVIGPLYILALFLFLSIPLMEKHLLPRRLGYAAYRQQVSAFVPWPRKRQAPVDVASQ